MALPHQDKVAKFYNSNHIQVAVAVLIGANFLTNIVEKEIDPHNKKHPDVFEWFGHFYNLMFTIELAFNMYAHWWRPFWKSNWNIFDVVVVTIGIVNTLNLKLPAAFGLLRMMRAFRVFRLFKRVHSLNKIIVAIMHAVPGVANAFLILFIVMSIYAILAVEFYLDLGAGCKGPDAEENFPLDLARWETARGFCMGNEYFGTFTKSLFTFFQVLTGESWSEMVSRDAIFFWSADPARTLGSGIFFVSYVLISSFVLTNVVVAVLLDKMVDPEVAVQVDEFIHADSFKGEQAEGDAEEKQIVKVESPPILTTDELNQAMTSATDQMSEYMEFSEKMSSEFNTLQSDMAAMRAQVANMLKCLPGNDNIEK